MGKYLGPWVETCEIERWTISWNQAIRDENDQITGYRHSIGLRCLLLDNNGHYIGDRNYEHEVKVTQNKLTALQLLNSLSNPEIISAIKEAMRQAKIFYSDVDDPDLQP